MKRRNFIGTIGAGIAGGIMLPEFVLSDNCIASTVSDANLQPPSWLEGITRVAYTDLGNISSNSEWPDKVISDFASSGVQMMFSRVHSGDTWDGLGWKSQYGDMASLMKNTDPFRDGSREVLKLCHQHGMRYIAYYWIQREPKSLGEEHPEWRCLDNENKITRYYCLNTPYSDLVRNRIIELVKEVGVDGIFFDMLHTRRLECYCNFCRNKFQKLSGEEPPRKEDFESTIWQQWVDFKYRCMEETMLEYNLAIKKVNPDAVIITNTWNQRQYARPSNTRNSIRMAENVDGLLEETGWYETYDPSFFAFPVAHNFLAWHLAGLCRDGRKAFMWGLPTTETETRIRVLTMMANGSVPAHSVSGRDVLKIYMADINERDEYFTGSQLTPWCGLVVSEKTELWYGKGNPKDRYIKGVYGAFQALTERHLPVSLVTDRDLELGDTGDNKVLFMPNCAAMSDSELKTVRNFVENGGGLVATYETSLYDEHGKRRHDFGFSELFRVKPLENFDNTIPQTPGDFRVTDNARLKIGEAHRWSKDAIILKAMRPNKVNESPETINRSISLNARMLFLEPQPETTNSITLGTGNNNIVTDTQDKKESPAIIETTFGKGKVFYLPFDISWAFFRYGHDYLGRLMELAIRDAAAEQPLAEVEAPSIVQATIQFQGKRLVIHLLNDISSMGRSQFIPEESRYLRREVIPIHDIKVIFRNKSLKKFLLVPGMKILEPVREDRGVTVLVPRLDIHCMVVAE